MDQNLVTDFRSRLDMFVFFHLGSDAQVKLQEGSDSIRVAIRHPRVHPFEFSLDQQRLSSLTADPDALEEYLLNQLTRHRRGGLGEE